MKYKPNTIYHIYNQGNNRQPIFLKEDNYLYFLKKMRTHISPYVEFLAYSLMPNHFHWLVYTKPAACEKSTSLKAGKKWTDDPLEKEELKGSNLSYQQKLSHEIKTMLSSYTRAINKQEGRSGSLFRAKTKSKNGFVDGIISLEGKNKDLFFTRENHYARICFHYIHKNAVEAELVVNAEDYIFSSARDFAGMRNGTLCNQALAKELLLL